jgi:hypothetical protein
MPPSSAYSRLHGVIDMRSVNRILRQWLKDHRHELPGQMAPATPFMDETLKALTLMFKPARHSASKAKLRAEASPKQDSHNDQKETNEGK